MKLKELLNFVDNKKISSLSKRVNKVKRLYAKRKRESVRKRDAFKEGPSVKISTDTYITGDKTR
jgi:hypothetical protein